MINNNEGNIVIKHISDLSQLNTLVNFDQITLEPDAFFSHHILDYAIKYSYWSLTKKGVLVINTKQETSQIQSLSNSKINQWQVRSEVIKLLSRESCDISFFPGRIEILNKSVDTAARSISIGVIFSGSDAEIAMIDNGLADIISPSNISSRPEIIICGPEDFVSTRFSVIRNGHAKYLPFLSSIDKYGRFLMGKKKNYLYKNLTGDVKIISHARIKYTSGFCEALLNLKFDIASPRVKLQTGEDYLDLILVNSYSMSRKNRLSPVSSVLYQEARFNYYRDRYPYLDGGIIIFNARLFPEQPFSEHLAWGEGEDLDLCCRANSEGILIDRLDSIICYSATSKVVRRNSLFSRLKLTIKAFLARMQLY